MTKLMDNFIFIYKKTIYHLNKASLLLVCVLTLPVLNSSVYANNTWTRTGDLNTPRAWHTATTLNSSQVLVTGGGMDSVVSGSVEIFDLDTVQWTLRASLNQAREKHVAILLDDNRVLVAGGSSATSDLASTEVYDPETNTWSMAASLSTPRVSALITKLSDGRVLVSGGSTSGTNLTTAEIYDPATNSWASTGAMVADTVHTNAAVLLNDGRVFIKGHAGYINGPFIDVQPGSTFYPAESPTKLPQLFDPVSNSWASASPMNKPKRGGTSILLNDGTVLVAGGDVFVDASWGYPNFYCGYPAEIYHPDTDTWTKTGSLFNQTNPSKMSLLPDGNILAFGSAILFDPYSLCAPDNGHTEIYDPDTGAWTITDSAVTRHDRGGAFSSFADGKVLSIGGGTLSEIVEIYTPAGASPEPPPIGSVMHIVDIDGQAVEKNNYPYYYWSAIATFTVHDEYDQPVEGAIVSSMVSTAQTVPYVCTTDSLGQCSKSITPGTSSDVNYWVTDVTKLLMTYDATANTDPDGDSDGTRILIQRYNGVPPVADAIHMVDLDDASIVSGDQWSPRVRLSARDNTGNPVSGGTISGVWGNGLSGSVSCTADSAGMCTIDYPESIDTLTFPTGDFSITNVAWNALPYDSSLNSDPEDDSDGTLLVLTAPNGSPPLPPPSSPSASVTDTILQELADGVKERTLGTTFIPLDKVPVPEPENLDDFILDKQKAIQLGKALFWDMQVGSDKIQACGTCHFNGGADSRVQNQLSPGLLRANQNGTLNKEITFSPFGPNFTLRTDSFPFHKKSDPNIFNSPVSRDSNDVVSSQGVHTAQLDPDEHTLDPEGFSVNNINTRRVEPRNTPTVINAVFNHRQFWDGRASDKFNGVTPFGDNDPNAVVYKKMSDGSLQAVRVSIDNASLASQAVGPPTSSLEMSFDGRTWQEIGDQFIQNRSEVSRKKGRRLKAVRPLGLQKVHRRDSVLGRLRNREGPGLKYRSYERMIKRAFKPEWWESESCVRINTDGSRTIVNEPIDEHRFNQMEMNFSLFFGLAVQLYEATLISDDSPVDRFLAGDASALSTSELVGFHLAKAEGRCLNCHGGPEFTFASVGRIKVQGETRIRKSDLIDEGFNNIGVRPTLEDLGVGGLDPWDNPLSIGRKLQLDPTLGTAAENEADLGADGAFKIPTLRNVELTAPYFHNGGESTLEDVLDFYFRGGNFRTFNPDLEFPHPIKGYDAKRENESPITGLGVIGKNTGDLLNSGPGLHEIDKANIIAFLKALTDERVLYRKAPFDHPQIFIPNGHPDNEYSVIDDSTGNAIDDMFEIPAVGAYGATPLPSFMDNLVP